MLHKVRRERAGELRGCSLLELRYVCQDIVLEHADKRPVRVDAGMPVEGAIECREALAGQLEVLGTGERLAL